IYHYYESLPHETVMLIHKISDIYIMLHRISIFDFATLEAMSQHSAIILSKIGGNLDFDMNSNIIFAEDVEANESILIKADFPSLKENNYNVFNCHFSKEAFVNQYKEFFEQMLVKEK
ncbi:glycosyltransferase, partial [Phocaeicola sp.]